MRIDGASMANLEVVAGDDGSVRGSLLHVLDHCASAGGKRLLRAWLCRPLGSVSEIEARQRAVAVLQDDTTLLEGLLAVMRQHTDLPRCAPVSCGLGRICHILRGWCTVARYNLHRACEVRFGRCCNA